jgi:hypothetical protein
MRESILLASLVLGLGCAHTPAREGRIGLTSREDPRFVIRSGDPFWSSGGVTFDLDRPSYIAVFYVYTGGVVRAFYPFEVGQPNRFLVGQHTVRKRMDPTIVGSSAAFSGPVLVIVACDKPLKFETLKGKVEGFSGIGATNFRFSKGPLKETMEALAREIVPNFAAQDWTAYYYSW